ncbi:hypothetical protein CLM62_32745 [Streptomyces sp. SA15]|uniref:hypothetical protein n=1 Tax=Streptomyces sp. SA15 TaxID=934019 RepID=UPI000BB0825A|nr:hypothetical protein [Streptomyces sp. SA15]PAZ11896.1 hypothetical protein CLM62_32745 [Streptomyces sp. SA15]
MPLFRRAEWPRDHRDEVVAGALVGAVVIVLGYASGIGAPSRTTEAAVPPTAPPAATAPASPAAPGDAGARDPGAGTGQFPVTGGGLPPYGGIGGDTGYGTGGQGGHTGHGGDTGPGGHSGHETPPPGGTASPTPTPTPTPSPTDPDTCEDGEVTLVRPLLTALTQPVFGLLNPTGTDGTDATPQPEPQPSPCVGLAPVGSLLGGTASPQPEATP